MRFKEFTAAPGTEFTSFPTTDGTLQTMLLGTACCDEVRVYDPGTFVVAYAKIGFGGGSRPRQGVDAYPPPADRPLTITSWPKKRRSPRPTSSPCSPARPSTTAASRPPGTAR